MTHDDLSRIKKLTEEVSELMAENKSLSENYDLLAKNRDAQEDAKNTLAAENAELRRLYGELGDSSQQAITRLAEQRTVLRNRVAELETQVERLALDLKSEQAVLHMTVSRLGGIVDGFPTARGNFLQRIDELVEQRAAMTIIRDNVLNQRGPLEGYNIDNDIINAVLAIIDDAWPLKGA